MTTITATESAEIDVAPDIVYGIIADYRNGHPRILPPQYFGALDVEKGGTGAGTVIRFEMRVFGKTRTARAEISEPQPGRVLMERVLDERGIVTTFTVDPRAAGRRSRVTIDTQWSVRGISGRMEKLIAAPMLRRIYRAELAQLGDVARAARRARATS